MVAPTPGIPALAFDSVQKSFAGVPALHPLSLDVPANRTVVLIGPSGCGKSTLLRLAVGLLAPDAGAVRVLGTALNAASARTLRLRLGYVIQEGGLFPHLTAAENAGLVAREEGWTAERIAQRTRELAALVHLSHEMLARYPGELSGGQRQRVGLMRALMLDPDLLLMDEPLGALDPIVRARLQADLKEIFRRLGKSVLLVTHDLSEAAFLGDEIVLMREGRVVQRGGAADLLERPADAFVTEFIQAQRPLWTAS